MQFLEKPMFAFVPHRSSALVWMSSKLLRILSTTILGTLALSAGDGKLAASKPQASTTCVAKPASSRIVNVRNAAYGAKANGKDDTDAIQKALDTIAITGGTVLIPDGTYMVNAIRNTDGGNHGLAVKSNTTLRLAPGAILKAFPNGAQGYEIVRVANARNVNIIGGTIEGDRSAHTGIEGEWGMGISLLNARDVVVEGVTAKENWGDGFYVGGSTGCSNVTFCKVTADHNRRQGLSIVSADGVVVLDSTFKNTAGTPPECGLDMEPDAHETVNNVLVKGCVFTNNLGGGVAGGPAYVDRFVSSVTGAIIESNTFSKNGGHSPNIAIGFSACSGNIIRNNLITNNQEIGILLRSEALSHIITGNTVTGTKGHGIYLEDCAGSMVTGNTVTGNSGHGILAVRGHGATISGNTVSNNGQTP